MKPKLLFITAVLFLFGILLITGCEKQATNPNPSPEVLSLKSALKNLYTGETVKVTCNAVDPDGEGLSYSWSATGGTFANATLPQVDFTAPAQPGGVVIKCAVSDAKGQRWATVNVNVATPPPLLARWTFDTDFKDKAGTNDGTPGTGTSITNADFKVGTGSAKFTGTASSVAGMVTDGTALGMGPQDNFTITLWLRTRDTAGWLFGRLLAKGVWDRNAKGIYITGSNLAFAVRRISTMNTGIAVNDSVWHHVAVSKNGLSVTVFLDGNQVANQTYSDWTVDDNTTVCMGAYASGAYLGLIDDIRFYGRAMVSDEIGKVVKETQ